MKENNRRKMWKMTEEKGKNSKEDETKNKGLKGRWRQKYKMENKRGTEVKGQEIYQKENGTRKWRRRV
jgi:hypothetical protein